MPTSPPPPSARRSVFISHASKNFKLADEVRAVLEAKGISCWIAPRDIPAGGSYGAEIIDGIRQCSVFLLLLTRHANLSTPVRNEVERAFGYQKVIIPVRLDEIRPAQGIEFFVANAQWIDAIHSPLRKRMDEVAAIVYAVETSGPLPTVAAEQKTLGGRLEKWLESVFRHKTASVLAGFTAVLALTAWGITLQQGDTQKIVQASSHIQQSTAKIDTAAASLQQASQQVAALESGLGSMKKEVSDDPRKELVSRGFSVDDAGLKTAFAQADLVAIRHFNASGYVARDPGVIRDLFFKSWNPEVAQAIAPAVLASVCSAAPVDALIHPLDEKVSGAQEHHTALLKPMVKLCGADRVKSQLLKLGEQLQTARELTQGQGESPREAIESARLKINPNKYSKAAQHQKSSSVEAREMGRCGQPDWPCTYAGEGLSPAEFEKFAQERMAEVKRETSESQALQAQIAKYAAKIDTVR